ncbi:MAG: 30S ribosomal protein S13 [Haloarculaceae archaeon]
MSAEDPPADEEADEEEDIRYFVRIGQTDLDGTKSVERALTDMNGIGKRAARVITEQADIDRRAVFGKLEEEEIDEIVDLVQGYAEEVPEWMTNHQHDFYDGQSTHEVGNDLELQRRRDINRMQMIDSYKGVRHKRGQKVRGQRTKSTGRTEGTIGVNVEAIKEEQAEEAAAAEEGGEE